MADNYFNINATNTQAPFNLPLPPEQPGGGGIQPNTEYIMQTKYITNDNLRLYDGTLGDYIRTYKQDYSDDLFIYHGNYHSMTTFDLRQFNDDIYDTLYIELSIPESETVGFYSYGYRDMNDNLINSPVANHSAITYERYAWHTTSVLFNPGEKYSWFIEQHTFSDERHKNANVIIPSDESLPFFISIGQSKYSIQLIFTIWKDDNSNTRYLFKDFCEKWADKIKFKINMDFTQVAFVPANTSMKPDTVFDTTKSVARLSESGWREDKVVCTGTVLDKPLNQILNIK